MNAGWGIGAFLSAIYAPVVISKLRARRSVALSMVLLSACLVLLPFSRWLAMAVLLYWVMGSARGVGGTAITSRMMEIVPRHFMGRVQNTFYFFATLLQLFLGMAVGWVAHRVSLTAAFAMIGLVYFAAFASAAWPAPAEPCSLAATRPTAD
jgi:MFS family permease